MPRSLTLTDLDQDNINIAEIGFAYRVACTGDVAPPAMKYMLLENRRKYALRGEMINEYAAWAMAKGETGDWGALRADPAFAEAPGVFLRFATQRWHALKYEDPHSGP